MVLKSKLNWKKSNKCMGLFKYGGGILQSKESELKDVDRKSRKSMTMYGALHPKINLDRLYIKRKEGGRGLMSVERCVREEENSLGFYVVNSEENLIKRVAATEAINTEGIVTSGEFKKQKAKNLNKTSIKRKCMDISPGKCQRKSSRIELGIGYLKVI